MKEPAEKNLSVEIFLAAIEAAAYQTKDKLIIEWTKELIEEVKEYLRSQSSETKNDNYPKRLDTYLKQWRFKKLFSNFTLGDDNNLYILVNEEEDLPNYFLDENGELLFDVNLPMKFKLIETQKGLMEMLNNMRPVLQDGKQLLDSFSGMFGGNGGGAGGLFKLGQ